MAYVREIKSKGAEGNGKYESIVIENPNNVEIDYDNIIEELDTVLIIGNVKRIIPKEINYVIRITKIEEEILPLDNFMQEQMKLISVANGKEKYILTYYRREDAEEYSNKILQVYTDTVKHKVKTRYANEVESYIKNFKKRIRARYGEHKILNALNKYNYLNKETGELEYHKKLNTNTKIVNKYAKDIDIVLPNGNTVTLKNTLYSKENIERDIENGRVKYDWTKNKLYRIYLLSEYNEKLFTEYVRYSKSSMNIKLLMKEIIREEIYNELPSNVNQIIDEYTGNSIFIQELFNDINVISVVQEDKISLPFGKIPTKRGIERYEYKEFMENSSLLVKNIDSENLNFKYYKVIGRKI